MPDAVLDMRFAHYLEDFADDEGFLQATHQAGLQVEKKKALKASREATKGGPTPKAEGYVGNLRDVVTAGLNIAETVGSCAI